MRGTLVLPLLAVALASGVWLTAAPIVSAQEPPQTAPVASATAVSAPAANAASNPSGGPFDLLPDPKQWAADVFNQVLANLLRGIADALQRVIGAVLGSSLNFITQTPPAGSYASPTVVSLWNIVRAIANAGLILVALWGGVNLIVREHVGAPYHEAMKL